MIHNDNITKVISLKHKLVTGVEQQHRHPMILQSVERPVVDWTTEAALWALINGFNPDDMGKLAEEVGSKIFTPADTSHGEINIPGGWANIRSLFELRTETPIFGQTVQEVISGYVHDGAYYPTRLTVLGLRQEIEPDPEQLDSFIRSQGSLVYLTEPRGNDFRADLNLTIQMPRNVGHRIQIDDLRAVEIGENSYVDMRSFVNSNMRMIGGQYLSYGNYLEAFAIKHGYIPNALGQSESINEIVSRLQGAEIPHHPGFFRLFNQLSNQSPYFTQQTLAKMDPEFIPVDVAHENAFAPSMFNKEPADMETHHLSASRIRRLLNILESGRISLDKDIFEVTFQSRPSADGGFVIPDDMYPHPRDRERVLSKLENLSFDFGYITSIYVSFCLNGITVVDIYERTDMGKGKRFQIPTYAGGLISPLVVAQASDLAPAANLFARFLAE